MIQSGQARYRSKTRCVDPFWPRQESGNKSNRGPRKFDPKKKSRGIQFSPSKWGPQNNHRQHTDTKEEAELLCVYMYILPSCLLLLRNSVLSHSISGRIVERILRPIHVRMYGKAIEKPRCGFFTNWAASPTISWNCTVGLLPLRNKCVHICLPPSTWGGRRTISNRIWMGILFFRLGICARHFVRLLSLHYVVPSSSLRTSLKAACLLSGCPVIDVVVVLLYTSF
jgi:hypothetical protein